MNDLRFLHIPKTAGSTFANILVDRYGLRSSFQFMGLLKDDRHRWDNLPGRQQGSTSLFLCHSPLVTGIGKADQAALITFLRDPAARTRSFCQHVYEGKSPYLRERFPPFAFTATELLASGELELENLQTRVLAGTAGGGTGKGTRAVPAAELLERAWQNLRTDVLCFGLLEEFDASLLLFARKLGWQAPPWYVRLNRRSTTRKLEFTVPDLERIRELNRLDDELYRRAKALFYERLQEEGITGEEVERFRRASRRRSLYTALRWLPLRLRLKVQRLAGGSS